VARIVSLKSRTYAVGEVITQRLDSFPPFVQGIRVMVTREPDGTWPGTVEEIVATVTAQWNDGSGITWSLPGGVVPGHFDPLLLAHELIVYVPKEANPEIGNKGQARRKAVVGAIVRIAFHRELQTAITMEAAG
jgi:hypothetical protein